MTVLLAATASVTIAFLATACGAGPGTTGDGGPPPPPSNEVLYRATLLAAESSFDRGVLSYTPLSHLKTATASEFKVVVTDVGRGPQTVFVTTFSGMIVFPEDVPTGAIVGVRAVSCVNLTCRTESDARQPILTRGQQATWSWQVTGGNPGQAEITLRTDTYYLNSSQSLISRVIHIYGLVQATSAFQHQQTRRKIAHAARTFVNLVETIGAIAASIAAVGGIIGWLVMQARKRRAATDSGDAAASSAEHARRRWRTARPGSGTKAS